MIQVKVKFFAHLRESIGGRKAVDVDLPEYATVSMMLEKIALDKEIKNALFDEGMKLKDNIVILRNGREIKFLEEFETVLNSGDEVSIFPLVVGG